LENEQLKQEVARLTKDLTQVKGKMNQAQLHQDNTIKGVKKLDEGQTMVLLRMLRSINTLILHIVTLSST
jgi:hypothetical protein